MDENLIDAVAAAEMLGITTNNLRQMVFKKKIAVKGKAKRRALFDVNDVMTLKQSRMKELKITTEAIGVSQQDHPQDF